MRVVVDAVLAELDDEFASMLARTRRLSVPPEQLLKAMVLMALYSIRSERAFCERLNNETCCSSGSWACRSDHDPTGHLAA